MKAAYTAQRTKETVLDAIARLLPFVPRDLDVDVKAVPSKERPGLFTTTILVEPKTDMGRAIHSELKKRLPSEMAKVMSMKAVKNEEVKKESGEVSNG